MSAIIDMSNGRENFAFVGRPGWHGLGSNLQPGAPLEEWAVTAGLNFKLEKRPLLYGVLDAQGNRKPRAVENRFAHVRDDTQACVGIGSDRFQLVQPAEILEFYRDLLTGSDYELETAGSLKGGATVFALAKCKKALQVGRDDTLLAYLLLATANDGSMSTIGKDTTVRVVCANTLEMAVAGTGGVRVPHSRQFDAEEMKQELGLIDDKLAVFGEKAETMAARRVTDREAIAYFVELYGKKDDKGNLTNERTVKSVTNDLMRAFRNGPGAELETANFTAWGLLNAVTNHVDFRARARTPENRFNSSQFGPGANIKAKAFESAMALAA